MKFILFLIIIFISACSAEINNNFSNNINFSKEMSIDEIKIKLKEYTENSTYPNIDD